MKGTISIMFLYKKVNNKQKKIFNDFMLEKQIIASNK